MKKNCREASVYRRQRYEQKLKAVEELVQLLAPSSTANYEIERERLRKIQMRRSLGNVQLTLGMKKAKLQVNSYANKIIADLKKEEKK